MGRSGITYEQVAAVADVLAAENGNATLKAVRERLGTGGMGTIHRHLTTWQANRPKAAVPVVALPDTINRELNQWVLQAATAARGEAEESLAQAQAAAIELAPASVRPVCREFLHTWRSACRNADECRRKSICYRDMDRMARMMLEM